MAKTLSELTGETEIHILPKINKFETAVRKLSQPLESPNIFVLVDEGHRTQHGTFNIEMQKALPNACYIALTGTPLFKKDKNSSIRVLSFSLLFMIATFFFNLKFNNTVSYEHKF